MTPYGLILCLLTCAISMCYVQSTGTALLRDLSTLIPPCFTPELNEALPRNSNDVLVYFYDRSPDGSYIFGYILSSGERRYERGIRYAGSLYVAGFYSYRKLWKSLKIPTVDS